MPTRAQTALGEKLAEVEALVIAAMNEHVPRAGSPSQVSHYL